MTSETPNARTLLEEVLSCAAEDWVHPPELLGSVSDLTGIDDPNLLRDLSVGLIARLLADELILVGDVVPIHGFVPWQCMPGEAVLRVAKEWASRDNPFVMPGELFWLAATPAGIEIGESVWRREKNSE